MDFIPCRFGTTGSMPSRSCALLAPAPALFCGCCWHKACLCSRAGNAGVASFVRVLNYAPQACHRFLHLFHSDALDLDVLTSCWVRLCLKLFRPFEVGSRLVLLADGIKAPKEGKRMPGVKMLHQQSASTPTARVHHGAFFASCFLAGALCCGTGGGGASDLADSRGAGVLKP